jgi:hypothetical protein
MKTIIIFILSIFTSSVIHAETIELNYDDQLRLADLVIKLPSTVRRSMNESISTPKNGTRITSIFPKRSAAWLVVCAHDYFNGSEYPSYVQCELTVDEHHPDLQVNYDQYQIMIANKQMTTALYNAISYGDPEKEFRSFGKRYGTNFEGKSANIFRYYFNCSVASCRILLSKLKKDGLL